MKSPLIGAASGIARYAACLNATNGDYVARRDTGAVTSALNEIADEVTADRGSFGDRAVRSVLERDEW